MILVTGATGHVGRAVVCRLASLGHDVVAMVRDAQAASGRLPSGIALRYAMQLCKQDLESPQIESGDIVSGLTAGHQIGNQLPGHGRQCQTNVLVPYRIEDRCVFETTDARKIVRKHRS